MRNYPITLCAALLMIAMTAGRAPVYGWGNGEGSAYAQGNIIGSLALSFHHFGAYGAFDYGLHDCISAGAAVGYDGYKQLDVRYNHIPLMARVAFHPFNLSVLADKIIIRDMVDVYLGITTGVLFIAINKGDEILAGNSEKTGFRVREYLGMRYAFTERWGFFVEDCGDVSTIAAGVSYRL